MPVWFGVYETGFQIWLLGLHFLHVYKNIYCAMYSSEGQDLAVSGGIKAWFSESSNCRQSTDTDKQIRKSDDDGGSELKQSRVRRVVSAVGEGVSAMCWMVREASLIRDSLGRGLENGGNKLCRYLAKRAFGRREQRGGPTLGLCLVFGYSK